MMNLSGMIGCKELSTVLCYRQLAVYAIVSTLPILFRATMCAQIVQQSRK